MEIQLPLSSPHVIQKHATNYAYLVTNDCELSTENFETQPQTAFI